MLSRKKLQQLLQLRQQLNFIAKTEKIVKPTTPIVWLMESSASALKVDSQIILRIIDLISIITFNSFYKLIFKGECIEEEVTTTPVVTTTSGPEVCENAKDCQEMLPVDCAVRKDCICRSGECVIKDKTTTTMYTTTSPTTTTEGFQ